MRLLQLSAVVMTALAFVPVGAHLFELPNKIGLCEQHYFVVQSIYGQVRWLLDKCGWGAVVAGALRAAKSSSMSSRTALS